MNANKIRTLLRRGVGKAVIERLLKQAVYVVPHNPRFRPEGVADIREDSPDFSVEWIERGVVSETVVPAAFFKVMLNKAYDEAGEEGEFVRMRSPSDDFLVASVPEGRLCSDNLTTSAIITRGNRLLSDVSFQYVTESTDEANSKVFKQRYFRAPERIEGNTFVMLPGGLAGRGNFYHWFVDVLPRLYLLQRSSFAGKIDRFVVPQCAIEFQKASLELVGVDLDRVVPCTPFTHLSCENLVVSSHPRGRRSMLVPAWVFDFYGQLKERVVESGDFPKRIYITRKDTSLRGVHEEDRLIEFLAGYGFEPVTLAEYGFRQKVNLFDHAEAVISPHGAGLTNLFFSRPGCKLLELFSEGFVDLFFLNLAERRKVDYHYLIFGNANAAFEDQKGQYEDIFVDYEALKRKMETFL